MKINENCTVMTKEQMVKLLDCVLSNDVELLSLAVKPYGTALQYIEEKNPEFCALAVKRDIKEKT